MIYHTTIKTFDGYLLLPTSQIFIAMIGFSKKAGRSQQTRFFLDHKAFLSSLSSDQRNKLMTTSNLAGLSHLCLYGIMHGIFIAIVILQPAYWQLALLPLGIVTAFYFTLQHECTHNTPFRSRWLNTVIGHLTALILCQPFLWFRHFHMAHHRHTNDTDHDPELSGLPKPNDWKDFILHLSCVTYWRDKIIVLWQNAFGGELPSYIPAKAKAAIRTEARMLLLCYAGIAALIVGGHIWLLFIWLMPVMLGFPFLRLYLLAEHGRCPRIANMFENTRTIYTHKLLNFLAWNMPFHTEHHILPAVPFHHLPALNKLTKGHLKVTAKGYTAFASDYVSQFEK